MLIVSIMFDMAVVSFVLMIFGIIGFEMYQDMDETELEEMFFTE